MARIFANNTEITDYVGQMHLHIEGGGGGSSPQFTETKIADNSSGGSSFTFDDDYHNYDFVRFTAYDSASNGYVFVTTTPSMLDASLSVAQRVTIGGFGNNRYCTYSVSNSTWTIANSRALYIYEVYGLSCNNFTVNETVIYQANSLTTADVSISTQVDLTQFDAILFSANSSDRTEVLPCLKVYLKESSSSWCDGMQEDNKMAFNWYNAWKSIEIDQYTITSARYFFVVGINFT